MLLYFIYKAQYGTGLIDYGLGGEGSRLSLVVTFKALDYDPPGAGALDRIDLSLKAVVAKRTRNKRAFYVKITFSIEG